MSKALALVRALVWTVSAAALALGGAGLVGEVSHPPGDEHREELTYAADLALAPQLDDVAARLTTVSGQVEALSGQARTALTAVAADNGTALQTALQSGTALSGQIGTAVTTIRAALAELPGDGPDAAALYSNDTLLRRAELDTALQAVSGLAGQWSAVTTQAENAASITLAIRTHDATLASAAGQGVKANYTGAITLLTQAEAILANLQKLRSQVIPDPSPTVLDDWIDRNQTYDEALAKLYQALVASHGVRNPTVDAAYRAENIARAALPDNSYVIVVIVSEVATGGLNQAVVAIEDARGRIDQALAAESPGSGGPPSGQGSPSP